MKVLINEKYVVVGKGQDIIQVENGFLIPDQNIVFAPDGLKIVETNLDPVPHKDLFINGQIMENKNYKTEQELKLYDLVVDKIITKEQYKTLTGKDFVV
jgi:hypothetical protein